MYIQLYVLACWWKCSLMVICCLMVYWVTIRELIALRRCVRTCKRSGPAWIVHTVHMTTQ